MADTRSDGFCKWPFLYHHVFMHEISKCHINSWLLLFSSVGDSASFDLLLCCPLSPSHSLPLSTIALSLSMSFRPLRRPPALCCDRLVRLVFGCAMCSAGRQPVQCVEPRGCGACVSGCLPLSLSLWLVAGLPGHGCRHITRHLLPLTSLQPGDHTDCPLASPTLFTDRAAFGSAVEFAAVHP